MQDSNGYPTVRKPAFTPASVLNVFATQPLLVPRLSCPVLRRPAGNYETALVGTVLSRPEWDAKCLRSFMKGAGNTHTHTHTHSHTYAHTQPCPCSNTIRPYSTI